MVNHTNTQEIYSLSQQTKNKQKKSILVKAREEEKQDILIRKFCISNVKENNEQKSQE